MSRSRSRLSLPVALGVAAVLLAGCSGEAETSDPAPAGSASSAPASSAPASAEVPASSGSATPSTEPAASVEAVPVDGSAAIAQTPTAGESAAAGGAAAGPIELTRPDLSAVAAADSAAFPITVEHGLGSTTIPAQPQRIVALGAVERDAVIALGAADRLVGVGVPFYDDSVNPWIADLVADNTFESIPWDQNAQYNVEQILSLQPDLVLAPTSFTVEQDYPKLSAVVPTVAYLQSPMVDRWQDVTELVGAALGQPEQAAALVADAESSLQTLAEAYPGLAGKSMTFTVAQGGGAYGVLINTEDTMLKNLGELGLVLGDQVSGLTENPLNPGVADISAEQIGSIDADLVLVAHLAPDAQSETEANPLFDALPGVQGGGYQSLGLVEASALRTPTVLSLHWGLNAISSVLAEVAAS